MEGTKGNKVYQRDADCPETGDLVITSKFSKVLEAYSIREKRAGRKLSYVWTAEAQTKRQEKFGGVGDIHFHLITNTKIKSNNGAVVDHATLFWLQDLWCQHVGVHASNCVHVDPLPDDIRSMPAYLSKYLGKGSQRMIIGRQFAATRDLTRFKTISLTAPPDCDMISSHDAVTPNGYEYSVTYYNTQQVLELYGSDMIDQGNVEVSRMDKNFTHEAIIRRAVRRQWRALGLSYSTEFRQISNRLSSGSGKKST